jgi:hypothetical protein
MYLLYSPSVPPAHLPLCWAWRQEPFRLYSP